MQREQLCVVGDLLELHERRPGLQDHGLQLLERRPGQLGALQLQLHDLVPHRRVPTQLQTPDLGLEVVQLLLLAQDLAQDEEDLRGRALERIDAVLVHLQQLLALENLLVGIHLDVGADHGRSDGVDVVEKEVRHYPPGLFKMLVVLDELEHPTILGENVLKLQKHVVPELDVARGDLGPHQHDETRCQREVVLDSPFCESFLSFLLGETGAPGKVPACDIVIVANQKHSSPRNNAVQDRVIVRSHLDDELGPRVHFLGARS
ncbi:hypothetical protein OGAPHI_005329 [Ogataea philodendri]|uniref:Uncharacterized protein n=1 Tax=Ogataea philodendri TaxID=1378263 RepID=A0A9P8P1G2_9ASCO|nr:uncharacterized protein OGAPHI_005329 [Ogataea philodendri]KAH3663339.1 hypothetical protein OGAPHI_005329 [Ogataea philodendri]